MSKYVSVDVAVDVHMDEIIDSLSDDEWVDLLKSVDDKVLAKAGLQRIPEEQPDSLTEHLALVHATRGGAA